MSPGDRELALEALDRFRRGEQGAEATLIQLVQHITGTPGVPPGRCGAPAPGLDTSCDLRVGHAGQHEARVFPAGVLSSGWPTHWSTKAEQ